MVLATYLKIKMDSTLKFSQTLILQIIILTENIACNGITQSAETVLNNDNLKKEILRILLLQSHQSLKTSLKKSQLCADKKERSYLLTLTPKSLCEEFRMKASPSFLLHPVVPLGVRLVGCPVLPSVLGRW